MTWRGGRKGDIEDFHVNYEPIKLHAWIYPYGHSLEQSIHDSVLDPKRSQPSRERILQIGLSQNKGSFFFLLQRKLVKVFLITTISWGRTADVISILFLKWGGMPKETGTLFLLSECSSPSKLVQRKSQVAQLLYQVFFHLVMYTSVFLTYYHVLLHNYFVQTSLIWVSGYPEITVKYTVNFLRKVPTFH